MTDAPSLSQSSEVGSLRVCHLKRFWSRTIACRDGKTLDVKNEWALDVQLLSILGLGLEQTMQYLLQTAPTFEQFEAWIVATAGPADPNQIARLNSIVSGAEYPQVVRDWLGSIDTSSPVFSEQDLGHWNEQGYVVLRDAVGIKDRVAAEQAVWEFAGANRDDVDTWYGNQQNGIMVQQFQHPAFTTVRRSPRIHKAFSQLWGTADLWVSTDRCGFSPPESDGWEFPGPDLHWDVDMDAPLGFATQGYFVFD